MDKLQCISTNFCLWRVSPSSCWGPEFLKLLQSEKQSGSWFLDGIWEPDGIWGPSHVPCLIAPGEDGWTRCWRHPKRAQSAASELWRICNVWFCEIKKSSVFLRCIPELFQAKLNLTRVQHLDLEQRLDSVLSWDFVTTFKLLTLQPQSSICFLDRPLNRCYRQICLGKIQFGGEGNERRAFTNGYMSTFSRNQLVAIAVLPHRKAGDGTTLPARPNIWAGSGKGVRV